MWQIYDRVSLLKYHLARILCKEVEICTVSSSKLTWAAHENYKKKEETTSLNLESVVGVARSSRIKGIFGTSDNETDPMGSPFPKDLSFLCSENWTCAEPSIRSMVKWKEKEEVDKLAGRRLFCRDSFEHWQDQCFLQKEKADIITQCSTKTLVRGDAGAGRRTRWTCGSTLKF